MRIGARQLAPGGTAYAATDDVAYAEQADQVFASLHQLESRHPGQPWLSRSPHPVQTRYERKWIAEGRPLHYFVFEKR
jgi:tRNA G46 methylase TrmB